MWKPVILQVLPKCQEMQITQCWPAALPQAVPSPAFSTAYSHQHHTITYVKYVRVSLLTLTTTSWGLEVLLFKLENPSTQELISTPEVSARRGYVHVTPEQHYKKPKYFYKRTLKVHSSSPMWAVAFLKRGNYSCLVEVQIGITSRAIRNNGVWNGKQWDYFKS